MSDWLRASGVEVGFAVLAVSTVLLVLCLIACRTVLRHRPAARSAVCTTTLVALLAVPGLAVLAGALELGLSPRAVTSPLPAPQAIAPPVYPPAPAAVGRAGMRGAASSATIDPVGIAAGLWLAVFGLTLLPLALSWWRGRSLRARSSVVSDPRWCELRTHVDSALGVRRSYELRASDAVQAPVAIGMLRPCVLLPASTIAQPPDAAAEAVLAHEVGHVMRHDSLGALLSRVVAALHWHHPLAWWLHREAAIAREEVCDNHALVVATPQVLSDALLAWTTAAGRKPGTLIHSVRGWSLERRVKGLLSGRRDVASRLPTGGVVALSVAIGALAVGAVSACTPRGGGDAPEDPSVTVATDSPSPRLDPVLTRFGWAEATEVSLEFVHDYGGRGEGIQLADGRPIPLDTTWTFPDARELHDVLSRARTVRFEDDIWLEAKAAFILHGKMPDGRRIQISFHSRAGQATVSRGEFDGELEGGAWYYEGVDEELVRLMQTRVPAAVELPLQEAVVWRVPRERSPTSHQILVARSGAELAEHLRDLAAPAEARAPHGFDYASGIAVVIRAPTHDPLRDLAWGTPLLRHGKRIVELVFERPAADAETGTAAVMLLFIEVHEPRALESFALAFLDESRVEVSLK